MRLGIAFKLALVLAAFGILAAALTGLGAYSSSREALRRAAERDLLTATQVLGRNLQAGLVTITKDVQTLAQLPLARRILAVRAGAAQTADELTLAEIFEATMQAEPNYVQIRLIAAAGHGLERVRVDRAERGLLRVEGDELQEKAHYPYVFETLRRKIGDTYLSDIAINQEEGAHAALNLPTLRVATPVTAGGETLGVLVINVDINGLFRLIQGDLPESYRTYLTNGRGDWLVHPDSEKTFGFDRGRRFFAQEDFAQLAEILDGQRDGMVFHTSPSQDDGLLAAFVRLPFGDSPDGRFLMLGLSQPLQIVQRDAVELGQRMLQLSLALGLSGIALSLAVSRAVTGPLKRMARAAREFSEGRVVANLPLGRRDEIGELARNFRRMQEQIGAQLAQLNESHRQVEALARTDALTGLPNRRSFMERLEQAVGHARRSGRPFALLFVDLDRFKDINDAQGHARGDAVLQAVAERLRATVREVDTVARLGGDEFTVLCEGVEHALAVDQIARKIHEQFQAPLDVQGSPQQVLVSIGVSLFPRDGDAPEAMLSSADAAMYRAKAQGRNAIVFS